MFLDCCTDQQTNLLHALERPRHVNAEADERQEEEYAADEAALKAVAVIPVIEVTLGIGGTDLVQIIIIGLGAGAAKVVVVKVVEG